MTARISHARRSMVAVGSVLGALTLTLSGATPAPAAEDVRSKQWYLDALYAEKIWRKTTGEGIKVAVIDSGVNPDTPSLRGQVLEGVDATVEKGGSTDDTDGQGTTTSELIAGTGKGGGLKGLAPGAKIIPIRVPLLKHDELPPGTWIERDPLYYAIRAAADSDAQIIAVNIRNEHAIGNNAYQDSAAEYAASKGKILIAGTGDNAKEGNKPLYPARERLVVGVSSVDKQGHVADYSQHGDYVHLAAPGVDIPRWCDTSFRHYCDGGGASAATAIASASAALIWSAHPDWTANQVIRVLFETASRNWGKDSRSSYLGHGIVRPISSTVRGKGSPGSPNINPLTHKDSMDAKSPSTSLSTQRPEKKEKGRVKAHEAGEEANDDSQPGVVAGIAAVVSALIAGVFYLTRKRRNS
ncbi:S8 family serine peptidase [Streptomyces sp. BBFR2]|uniref:S8 family serine peptidase n=1 Tax=Streptomyces sp. BBFR2 TaxID=3372854 RepID=UPI0037DA544A